MSQADLIFGMWGDAVAALQAALQRLRFYIPPAEISGDSFGAATRQAVVQFQIAHRLPATGVADERTVAAIMSAGASAPLPNSAAVLAKPPAVQPSPPSASLSPVSARTEASGITAPSATVNPVAPTVVACGDPAAGSGLNIFGIPRFNPRAEGIHLLWTPPDILPLSEAGYDIQRREAFRTELARSCETIDTAIIRYLQVNAEYPARLGPLRLVQNPHFESIVDPSLWPPITVTEVSLPEGFGNPQPGVVTSSVANASASIGHAFAMTAAADVDEFIQELDTPSNLVSIAGQARAAIAFGLAGGKVVATTLFASGSISLQLAGPSIDTVVLYTIAVATFTICAECPANPKDEDEQWSSAPYIAKGLTLPIHEADPALAQGTPEYLAAEARLVGVETLAQSDFNTMADPLRAPVANQALGRSGERILLVRASSDQSYEELVFEAQLSALSIDPKMRRVLGFGFADRKDLVLGQSYVYRITGRFRAEDLTDDIYDFHMVPAQTALPTYFTIRDLSVRLQLPTTIMLDPAPSATGLMDASRRGIQVDRTAFNATWDVPDFGVWSLIIDLPRPVTDVVLEVSSSNSFTYAGGDFWAFPAAPATPLPAGSPVALHFANPITELRLAGNGTLFAIRLPSGQTGLVEVHAVTAPILFSPEPLPAPPVIFTIYNLQQPPVTLTGPINESTSVPPRPPLGFRLNWMPWTPGLLPTWPVDLNAGPPLQVSAYQIDHRTVQLPSTYGAWTPVQSGDNITTGSRDLSAPDVQLEPGMDLDQVFPRIRPRASGAGFALHLSDVFGESDPGTNVPRPAQPPGSWHQYRIRSVDPVGRIGDYLHSNVGQLQLLTPPPLPTGPQPPPVSDANGNISGPPGPKARALVADAPGLTPDDVAILGSHQNAIVLEWGWRQEERDQDPYTTEFRVYMTRPPDTIHGTVNSVTAQSPNWVLSLTCQLPLVANECVGQWITTGGYPFLIVQNDAGATPNIVVQQAVANPAATPAIGPVVFGRPLQPQHQRPAGWGNRVAVIPLTSQANYSYVFYDQFTLGPNQPRDSWWVGVSAADNQSYVPDELTSGPNAPRPGNESSIAGCAVTARYIGQPVFSVPPPIGDVPEQVTDEPTGPQVLVPLDLVSLLGGALPTNSPVAIERCSSDDILSQVSVSGGQIVLTNPDGTTQTISFANPGDKANVLAALNSSNPQQLASRYLLYLLVNSSDTTDYFERISGQIDSVAVVNDRLPPRAGRFFYRVRAADAQGHISDGAAILPVVVRVPSTSPAATPVRQALTAGTGSFTIGLSVPPDLNTIQVLIFTTVTPAGAAPAPQPEAQMVRLANRQDLYPQNGLRMQLIDGTLVSPVLVKNLSDADVTTDSSGNQIFEATVPAPSGSWIYIWTCALTIDGFPSATLGPYGMGVN